MANHKEIEIHVLIGAVKEELKKRHYSDSYIGALSTIWNRLAEYLKKKESSAYSAKIGLNFLEAEYKITVYKKLSKKDKRCTRAINILSDYLLHGIIFPRKRQKPRTYRPQFQKIFQGYIDKKREYISAGFPIISIAMTLSTYAIWMSLLF